MHPTRHISFAPLADIPADVVIQHMSDPRVLAHLPLSTGTWNKQAYQAFMRAKQAYWDRDGLGHQAILCDGDYVGWGGFRREAEDWDVGLVLTAECFGLGPRILRVLLEQAKADQRMPSVTFLLPPSRKHLRPLDRLGAYRMGEEEHGGQVFIKFRLDTH